MGAWEEQIEHRWRPPQQRTLENRGTSRDGRELLAGLWGRLLLEEERAPPSGCGCPAPPDGTWRRELRPGNVS